MRQRQGRVQARSAHRLADLSYAQILEKLREQYNRLQMMRSAELRCTPHEWDNVHEIELQMRLIEDAFQQRGLTL